MLKREHTDDIMGNKITEREGKGEKLSGTV